MGTPQICPLRFEQLVAKGRQLFDELNASIQTAFWVTRDGCPLMPLGSAGSHTELRLRAHCIQTSRRSLALPISPGLHTKTALFCPVHSLAVVSRRNFAVSLRSIVQPCTIR